MTASQQNAEHLRGIVDMGSNGIRFSISTVKAPTARIMPTLYQNRVGISLYDAQYSATGERIPIGESTISDVLSAFKQFRQTCDDFKVPHNRITVLATEATRTAENSEAFRKHIKDAVGWDVVMLPKEEEGRVGAMGIASSLPEVSGLVMDLGGGSTQLSWLIKRNGSGTVEMPETGSVSMPYGAAAMSRRLVEAERNSTVPKLKDEIQNAVKEAYSTLNVPQELRETAGRLGGFTLYLSGGGFRGWGYVLMSRHRVQPYPIPVINGFKATREEFLGTDAVQQAAAAALETDDEDNSIFRVSDRRATQVPAVAFLVNVLAEALPDIKVVRFCQGGVREGFLFSSLPPEVRAQDPLVVATQPFDTSTCSEAVTQLLLSSLPQSTADGPAYNLNSTFNPDLLDAFANLMFYHSSHSKDLQTTSALRSTTSGILAGVHGVLHENRTMLALLLCARWGGKVPPADEAFKNSLERLVESPWTLWWVNYIGAVAGLVASVFPAGVTRESKTRVTLKAAWDKDEKQRSVLSLRVAFAAAVEAEAYGNELKDIEKTGKRKRWIGGRDGIGHRVSVQISI